MSELTKNEEVATTEAAVEAVPQLITSELASTYMETLRKVKNSKGAIQTNADYFKFAKEGDNSTGVFVGFVPVFFKKEDSATGYSETQDAAKWMVEEEKDGKPFFRFYIQAGAALVNEIKKNQIAAGTVITITYTKLADDKKTKLFNLAIVGV